MPSIFISHSAKDYFAQSVRQGIYDGLKDKFEVYLDQERIDPGEMWRAKLHRWMGVCHGAVILFSRDALSSEWVRKEATILTWRKSLQPKLKLVPVLLGDVKTSETGLDAFKPLQIGEIQFVKPPSEDLSDENANFLIEETLKCFESFSLGEVDPRLEAWIEDVAVCLEKTSTIHLERAAEILKIQPEDLAFFEGRMKTIAHQLLHADFAYMLPALKELKKSMPGESLNQLIELVQPSLVAGEAARNILPVTQYETPRRFLAINANYGETGDSYVRRATCCDTNVYRIKISNVTGESPVKESLGMYDVAARRALGIRGNRPSSTVRRAIDRLYQIPNLVFVIVAKPILNKDVLDALYKRYNPATFILLSGQDFPDREELGLEVLELIEPRLKPGEEEDVDVDASLIRSITN